MLLLASEVGWLSLLLVSAADRNRLTRDQLTVDIELKPVCIGGFHLVQQGFCSPPGRMQVRFRPLVR